MAFFITVILPCILLLSVVMHNSDKKKLEKPQTPDKKTDIDWNERITETPDEIEHKESLQLLEKYSSQYKLYDTYCKQSGLPYLVEVDNMIGDVLLSIKMGLVRIKKYDIDRIVFDDGTTIHIDGYRYAILFHNIQGEVVEPSSMSLKHYLRIISYLVDNGVFND